MQRMVRAGAWWPVRSWVGLCASLVACAGPMAGAPAGDEPLERLRARIGTPVCNRDAQCHTLAVGQRACGGPAAFWVWSDAVSTRQALQPLAQAQARLDAQRQAEQGAMSICSVVSDPGAHCDVGQGVCRLGRASDVPSAPDGFSSQRLVPPVAH